MTVTLPILAAAVLYLLLPTVGWILCAIFTGNSREDAYTQGYLDGRQAATKEKQK